MRSVVQVVIPVYKERLTGREEASFRHNLGVLSRYEQVLLAPEGLNLDYYLGCDPSLRVRRVSREWLGANGVAGYNRMMLSKEFYALFSQTEYILICQTDVWIFDDRLEEWCQKGYDYVGAPWPKRPIYNLWPVRLYLKLRKALLGNRRILMRQDYFGRVGNGGLSLRRIESFLAASERYASTMELFKSRTGIVYNEDWFWSLIPQEFRYPSFDEALGFSFDSHPELCYRLAKGVLPFGAHGWFKKRNISFWETIIKE